MPTHGHAASQTADYSQAPARCHTPFDSRYLPGIRFAHARFLAARRHFMHFSPIGHYHRNAASIFARDEAPALGTMSSCAWNARRVERSARRLCASRPASADKYCRHFTAAPNTAQLAPTRRMSGRTISLPKMNTSLLYQRGRVSRAM